MVDLTYRARSILEIWLRHKPETAVWFWKVLIDEDGYIWSSPDDEDIALLVEAGFLGPSGPCKPSDFLRGVAKDVGPSALTKTDPVALTRINPPLKS